MSTITIPKKPKNPAPAKGPVTANKPMPSSLALLKGIKQESTPSKLDRITERIFKRQGDFLVETGKDLIEAKQLMPHGDWEPWLKNFGLSATQAKRLMAVAKDPSAHLYKELPKSVQYMLASPSTPQKVKVEVIAEAKAGKKPTTKTVEAKLGKTKSPNLGDLPKALAASKFEPVSESVPAKLEPGYTVKAIIEANASTPLNTSLAQHMASSGLPEVTLRAAVEAFPYFRFYAEKINDDEGPA